MFHITLYFNLLIIFHFHSQYQRTFTLTNSRSVTLPTVAFAFTPFYTCAFTLKLCTSLFTYIPCISSPILRYLHPYYFFSFLFPTRRKIRHLFTKIFRVLNTYNLRILGIFYSSFSLFPYLFHILLQPLYLLIQNCSLILHIHQLFFMFSLSLL